MAAGKLWDKGFSLDRKIERFTVGRDRELDLLLAPWDILGTLAHCTMLARQGLLTQEELGRLAPELRALHAQALAGRFEIEEGIEDVHSQVELLLTRRLGDLGKKVHTGRSRNDQVLLDIKLFTRAGIERTVGKALALFDAFLEAGERYKDVLMPGYTHFQVAMPSSFGLWFGAYAESLSADMELLLAAWNVADRNPLGSAAGYGSSAPLDRELTTRLLGFAGLDVNSIYAQLSRGKTERIVAQAYGSLSETVARFAADCCLFNSQNFGFVTLPREMTTGSSIMPHKKNPDVFELLRAHCNLIDAVPGNIRHITANLPSGYFRDMQLIKEQYLPMFAHMDDCLDIALFAVQHIRVRQDIMSDARYQAAFSVEEVNRRVTEEGVPFRDAYRQVGAEIEAGDFRFAGTLHHTHAGSLGNLRSDLVRERMEKATARFRFAEVRAALDRLLADA